MRRRVSESIGIIYFIILCSLVCCIEKLCNVYFIIVFFDNKVNGDLLMVISIIVDGNGVSEV